MWTLVSGLGRDVLQPLQAEDVGEGLARHDLGGRELACRLVAKRAAVDDEADAPEALGREQAVEQRDGELGLAGAGRHRHQHGSPLRRQRALDGLDCALLVGAQRKAEVERLRLERGRRGVLIDLKQPGKPFRRRPVDERAAMVGGAARIAEPDAALGLDLLQVGAAVGGEDEGHPVLAPRPASEMRNLRSLRCRSSSARPDRWRPRHSCAAASPRPRRPASSRRTGRSRQGRSRSAIRQSPYCGPWRARALRVAQGLGVGLPAAVPKLLVDQGARLGLVEVKL